MTTTTMQPGKFKHHNQSNRCFVWIANYTIVINNLLWLSVDKTWSDD